MEPQIEIRRSSRRRRTVQARREGGRIIVMVPERLSAAEERQVVKDLVGRLLAAERRRTSGPDLNQRAAELSRRYLGGAAVPSSVRFVDNQNSRWGSCTIATRTIRLSARLQGMPTYVLECVLLHELAHLIEPHHNARFWELADRHERATEAKAYLAGVCFGAGLPAPQEDVDDVGGPGNVDDAADPGDGVIDAAGLGDGDGAVGPGDGVDGAAGPADGGPRQGELFDGAGSGGL